MDSIERDQRAKNGFGDRGEKLYKPERKRSRFKKNFKYDTFDKVTKEVLKVLMTK
jgi:hypothetical protein